MFPGHEANAMNDKAIKNNVHVISSCATFNPLYRLQWL